MKPTGEEDRLRAAMALTRALAEAKWPVLNINTLGSMARETLDILEKHRHVQEVAEFLGDFYADPGHTDSRRWHYMKRKYQYGVNLQGPEQLDQWFTQVLLNKQSKVYRPSVRYQIVSPDNRWLITVEPTGTRVSLMEPNEEKLRKLGEPLWLIQDLIV
jgi:hypothetical protein